MSFGRLLIGLLIDLCFGPGNSRRNMGVTAPVILVDLHGAVPPTFLRWIHVDKFQSPPQFGWWVGWWFGWLVGWLISGFVCSFVG